jgi:hypothetical protein
MSMNTIISLVGFSDLTFKALAAESTKEKV